MRLSPLRGAAIVGVVFASLVSGPGARAQGTPDLATAAAASRRPRECAPDHRNPGRPWHVNLWDSVRQPQLRRYCDLLGRAQARLASSPNVAREAAELADQILAGYAAPWVLRGRANVLLGDYRQAVRDFERARSVDPASIENPLTLVDFATALRRTGMQAEAIDAYRRLITTIGLLPSIESRTRVLLEAAALLMSTGASGLPEAVAVLRESVRQPLSRYEPDAYAMLLLALDRAGSSDETAAIVEHLALTGAPAALAARDPADFVYLYDPNEAAAVVAMALEHSDPAASASAWERFIASSPSSPYLAHARRHLEAMRRAPRPSPRPNPSRKP